jgi:hypothetical protein
MPAGTRQLPSALVQQGRLPCLQLATYRSDATAAVHVHPVLCAGNHAGFRHSAHHSVASAWQVHAHPTGRYCMILNQAVSSTSAGCCACCLQHLSCCWWPCTAIQPEQQHAARYALCCHQCPNTACVLHVHAWHIPCPPRRQRHRSWSLWGDARSVAGGDHIRASQEASVQHSQRLAQGAPGAGQGVSCNGSYCFRRQSAMLCCEFSGCRGNIMHGGGLV